MRVEINIRSFQSLSRTVLQMFEDFSTKLVTSWRTDKSKATSLLNFYFSSPEPTAYGRPESGGPVELKFHMETP